MTPEMRAYRAADRAYDRAVLAGIRVRRETENRVEAAWKARQDAYRAVYEAVPCTYCGAEPGVRCRNITWPTMHTARSADSFSPLVKGRTS